MENKTFWQSKTNVFNVLSTAVAVLGAVSGVLPPSAMPWVTLAVGVINVVLRTFFTTVPVGKAK